MCLVLRIGVWCELNLDFYIFNWNEISSFLYWCIALYVRILSLRTFQFLSHNIIIINVISIYFYSVIAPYLRIICISLFLIYHESITNAFASCSSNCHLIIVHTSAISSKTCRCDKNITALRKCVLYDAYTFLHKALLCTI